MLTIDDSKKLTKVFATKEELQQIRDEMATKEDLKKLQNKVLDLLDKVMGELKTIRQEGVFHNRQHERIEEEITELKSAKR